MNAEDARVLILKVTSGNVKFLIRIPSPFAGLSIADVTNFVRKAHTGLLEGGLEATPLSEKVLLSKNGYLLSPTDQLDGILFEGDSISIVDAASTSPSPSATAIKKRAVNRIPSPYSPEETKLRIELAAAYRIFDHYGWIDLIYNHLTVRLPAKEGEKHRFLINPFGLMFREVTAASLVTVDLEGNILDQGTTTWPINRAGYVIHSAVHEHLPKMQCVMHCHEDHGVAVSNMACGFMHKLDQNAMIVGEVAYHDFEGIALRNDEKERLVKNLGDSKIMILRNHGLLTCGESIGEAFYWMHYLIKACTIQVKSTVGGIDNLNLPTEKSYLETRKVITHLTSIPSSAHGEADFGALMRLIEEKDDSFRDLY